MSTATATPVDQRRAGGTQAATVSVRYIVDDVDAAIAFYCQHLGFEEQVHPAPTFAMLTPGDLRLVLELFEPFRPPDR